jgi:DNA-binding transcriptional ArsR family regulator
MSASAETNVARPIRALAETVCEAPASCLASSSRARDGRQLLLLTRRAIVTARSGQGRRHALPGRCDGLLNGLAVELITWAHPLDRPQAFRGHLALTGDVVSVCLPFVRTYQADGWTALGDPTRRAIFERLAERPRAVGELATELPVSRPAVSQHLKVLKEARLVVDQPAGTRRIYRLEPDGVGALRADLERFWGKALAAYKAVVEQGEEEVS